MHLRILFFLKSFCSFWMVCVLESKLGYADFNLNLKVSAPVWIYDAPVHVLKDPIHARHTWRNVLIFSPCMGGRWGLIGSLQVEAQHLSNHLINGLVNSQLKLAPNAGQFDLNCMFHTTWMRVVYKPSPHQVSKVYTWPEPSSLA